jgi:hypothetical protein
LKLPIAHFRTRLVDLSQFITFLPILFVFLPFPLPTAYHISDSSVSYPVHLSTSRVRHSVRPVVVDGKPRLAAPRHLPARLRLTGLSLSSHPIAPIDNPAFPALPRSSCPSPINLDSIQRALPSHSDTSAPITTSQRPTQSPSLPATSSDLIESIRHANCRTIPSYPILSRRWASQPPCRSTAATPTWRPLRGLTLMQTPTASTASCNNRPSTAMPRPSRRTRTSSIARCCAIY